MIPRTVVAALVSLAALLPVAIVIVLAVGRLLGAMDDAAGAAVLDRVALAGGLLWVLDLVCLLIVLGIDALGRPPR